MFPLSLVTLRTQIRSELSLTLLSYQTHLVARPTSVDDMSPGILALTLTPAPLVTLSWSKGLATSYPTKRKGRGKGILSLLSPFPLPLTLSPFILPCSTPWEGILEAKRWDHGIGAFRSIAYCLGSGSLDLSFKPLAVKVRVFNINNLSALSSSFHSQLTYPSVKLAVTKGVLVSWLKPL